MPGRDAAAKDVPDVGDDVSNAEQVIRKIWRSMLAGECGDGDSFFDAGGDSLAMMVMLGEVERQLKAPMPVAAFL
jgi:acyl carrier protein